MCVCLDLHVNLDIKLELELELIERYPEMGGWAAGSWAKRKEPLWSVNSRFKGSEVEGIAGCLRPWLACSPQYRRGGRWAAETGSRYVCIRRPEQEQRLPLECGLHGHLPHCLGWFLFQAGVPPCSQPLLPLPACWLAADSFQLVLGCGLSGSRRTHTVSLVLPTRTALPSQPAFDCLLNPLVTQSAMQSDVREPGSVIKLLWKGMQVA